MANVIFANIKTMENTLKELSDLPFNWNGNNAEPFAKEVLTRAQIVLDYFNGFVYLKMFPTAQQSIQFEFQNSNKNYLEIEVFTDKILGFATIGKEERTFEISEIEDTKDVVSIFLHPDEIKFNEYFKL
jgi:hypothetical protein